MKLTNNKNIGFEEAVQLICDGSLIVYPTETFFAIGGDALNPHTVEKVFTAKQRNFAQPLPVIVANVQDVYELAENIPEKARLLMEYFWPGPLTLLLSARRDVPDLLTGGTGYIAVRVSSHAIAQKLCQASGRPLISSSANMSGKVPAKSGSTIDPVLVKKVRGILTEGATPQGEAPSTIVSVKDDRVFIHRDGAISKEQLRIALGEPWP